MTLRDLAERVIETVVASGFDNRLSTFESVVVGVGGDETFEPEGKDRASLEETIEAAFKRHEATATDWPRTTDCDRLRAAFDALNAAGIVSLEHCGYDLQYGIEKVTDTASARDQVTKTPSRGYCFFHRQDTESAVEGHGLMLAFGSFETDGDDGPLVAGKVCSTCGGRGWVQPDPTRFPAPCPKHEPTVAPTPARTAAEQVGDEVTAALREVGLEVLWNGSSSTRIHLPKLRWQRRRKESTETELREFLASWELELRAGPTKGDPLELVAERIADWFVDSPTPNWRLLHRMREHTAQFLEAERRLEAQWNTATDNDRLNAVFAALRGRQVQALGPLGNTLLDGWGYAGRELAPHLRGVVFFNDEDIVDAADGQGLWLAYAAIPVDGSEWERKTAAVGREVVEVLGQHGLAWKWSGSPLERILVSPFEWRCRRWTTAPAVHSRGVDPFAPTHEAPPGFPNAGRELAEVIVARVNEAAYDLRRAARHRAAWRAAGHPGPAQVGNLGAPHVFVRAGDCTTVLPVAAAANLPSLKQRTQEVAAVWPRLAAQ